METFNIQLVINVSGFIKSLKRNWIVKGFMNWIYEIFYAGVKLDDVFIINRKLIQKITVKYVLVLK